jgi:hypothetical protein
MISVSIPSVIRGQSPSRLAIPGVRETQDGNNGQNFAHKNPISQETMHTFPYTGKFVQTVTHDEVLAHIEDGDIIITFDYDPDNEIIPITGLPDSLNEANWVAKRMQNLVGKTLVA